MRIPIGVLAGLLAMSSLHANLALAGDDPAVARVKEMLRRTQEVLRQAQAENTELARSKSDAEQKLQAATKQLDASRGASKAEIALRGQVQSAKAAQDDLTHKLNDTAAALAAANLNLKDTAAQLAAKQGELAEAGKALELGKAANASCESKNLQLYTYANDLLERYRTKGVWSALAQKEPVLGFKEVAMENTLQEYRQKFTSQKAKP